MSRFSERRSKASPMDFEYTSEDRRGLPSWTQQQGAADPHRKVTLPGINNTRVNPESSSNQPSRHGSPFSAFPPSSSNPFHAPSASPPPPNLFWNPSVPGSMSRARSMTPSSPPQQVADISMEDQSSSPISQRAKSMTDFVLENAREQAINPPEEEVEERLPLLPTRKASTNSINRLHRERQRTRSKLAQRRDIDDEEDDETEEEQMIGRQGGDSITANHHYTFNMPGMPANRSEVPYMLLGYVQFLFNLSLVLVFLYIIVHGIITVQRDVEHRIGEYRTDLAEQIANCAHLYEVNRCFPLSQRVPALARKCSDWESCMQKDPSGVGRARVVAETIGEVINSFVEPISWKTLGFGLTSLGFLITLINVLFSFYRARVAPHPHLAAPVVPPYLGPGTPVASRIAPPFLTPSHHYMTPGGAYAASPIEWSRTWSGTDMPIPGTPTRRRGRGVLEDKLGAERR